MKALVPARQLRSTLGVAGRSAQDLKQRGDRRSDLERRMSVVTAAKLREQLPNSGARREVQRCQEHLPIPTVQVCKMVRIWDHQLKSTVMM